MTDFEALKRDFISLAEIAGVVVPDDCIRINHCGRPHELSGLSSGKMAVYVFELNGQCLKVGKVGSKSAARFLSQHYNPRSSKSNLAKSLLDCEDLELAGRPNESEIGTWIKQNVDRTDFLLDINIEI